MRVAFVLWRGALGGAESITADLADAMKSLGVKPTVVFVETVEGLEPKLRRLGVPHRSLHLPRGRAVLFHPRAVANAVAEVADAAILVECGFLGAALRIGGFRGRLVAVEHGGLLQTRQEPLLRRTADTLARIAGAWADDAEVAVSDYMLDELRSVPHARRTVRIYNGINLPDDHHDDSSPSGSRNGTVVIGSAGRFVPGKGFDVLLQAISRAAVDHDLRVLLAGEGPERRCLQDICLDLGIMGVVEFLGRLPELRTFWPQCDIAVIPSSGFVESFSMTTLEAMAFGCAIVATRNGGIPELVEDGKCGTLVPPGNVESMADAIATYVRQPSLRRQHGAAARRRCRDNFEIRTLARSYAALLSDGEG